MIRHVLCVQSSLPLLPFQAIGMLSFSGSLTLDGVELKLPVPWQRDFWAMKFEGRSGVDVFFFNFVV